MKFNKHKINKLNWEKLKLVSCLFHVTVSLSHSLSRFFISQFSLFLCSLFLSALWNPLFVRDRFHETRYFDSVFPLVCIFVSCNAFLSLCCFRLRLCYLLVFLSLQFPVHILGFKVLRLAVRNARIELRLFCLWGKKQVEEEGSWFLFMFMFFVCFYFVCLFLLWVWLGFRLTCSVS